MKPARDEEFRDYVLRHRGDLVRTATLFAAGNHHLAEDVVQSTLTRLYVAWPAFRRVDNQRAYVRRALVNALIDEQRRPWRRERSTPDLPDRPAPEAASTARVDQLNQALSELPPRMRAALVLRYFDDLSVADTADALGCSQGTVKSQTARALDKLRHVLEVPALTPVLLPATPTAT
jgi:RNA polymerase sigma-70 factor (sigma-E family)